MGTVTRHSRLRKFYGIVSLKTDIILLSDIRMCNKSGSTDMKFINDTFAINPYCSYTFLHQSVKNSRGVGILIKKALMFDLLDSAGDPGDNFLVVKARINTKTVILVSIYGPNNRDIDFFSRLTASIRNAGDHPVIIGGDWNTTFSCLPVTGNPDVLNMAALPNPANSKKIKELCESLKLTDPYRLLYPNRIEFSYAPWGNTRDNRSRIDFFLISEHIAPSVEECKIKPSVQSKLFDHKAITLSFRKKIEARGRPTISNKILRDPDIEIIVKLAAYECYVQMSNDYPFKVRNLDRIGRSYKLLRDAGPDSRFLDYSFAKLIDYDIRDNLITELRGIIDDLDMENIFEREHTLQDDAFLEYLVNNIRNEVISYQSFIFKKINESYDNLVEKLETLKNDTYLNQDLISDCELKLREFNEIKINSVLEKNPNFAQLNSERITPFFF
jgi:exonuclease III